MRCVLSLYLGDTMVKFSLLFLFMFTHYGVRSVPPAEVTIGPMVKILVHSTEKRLRAIFSSDIDSAASKKAFEIAVEYVNNKTSILPSTQLKYIVNETTSLSPLSNVQKACYQISNGVAAIFGPITSTDIKATSLISSDLQVPIYAPAASNPAFASDYTNFPFLLRMIPSDLISTQAIADLFVKFMWKRVAILTSNTDYATGVTAKFHLIALEKEWSAVTTQEFDAISNAVNLDVRGKLKQIKEKGVRVVLVSCIAMYVPAIMKQAKELDMIYGWAWIIADLGENISPIAQETIGLVSIRPITNQGALYSTLSSKLTAAGLNGSDFSYDTAKRFDSVMAFAKGLHNYFQDGHSLDNSTLSCGSCQGDSKAKANGSILMAYLQQVQTDGASNFLNFSTDGSPGISKFEVMNLQANGWTKVGDWDIKHGLSLETTQRSITWPGSTTDIPVDTKYRLGNNTLKVLTIMEPPFIQLKQGNLSTDPYEGLCIDLLKRLAKDMQFKYTLDVIPTKVYGSYDPDTQRWTGLVGELVDKKYDMVVAPITISQVRAQVVDFSKPYMDQGYSILMKIPSKPETNIFGFVDPFSREVWMTCFALTAVIGLISLLFDKLSPNGHYGSVVQSELDEEDCEPSETDGKLHKLVYLNLTNSMWFSIGAFLQQGGDVLPRSISGRTVAAFWWCASMILIATYTANLAAFLTFSRMKISINSVEQLGSQIDVRYGTVRGSPAQGFFKNSSLPSFNGMYQFMEAMGGLVETDAEGVEKVRNENYAFIWDSIFLDRAVYKAPCDVFKAGQVFGHFGYGLVFQKNSPYTTRFSLEILNLRELGVIEFFENYWFKQQGDCTPDLTILQPSTGQLTLDDMIGVLFVVYIGIALGTVIIFIEWCVASYWEVDPTDPEKPNTWGEAMKKRISRIWRDMRDTWINKLKCCKKGKNSSTTKVTAVELSNKENQEAPKMQGRMSKGYTRAKIDVRPFQATPTE